MPTHSARSRKRATSSIRSRRRNSTTTSIPPAASAIPPRRTKRFAAGCRRRRRCSRSGGWPQAQRREWRRLPCWRQRLHAIHARDKSFVRATAMAEQKVPLEAMLERVLVASRWLLAPFFLGLALAVVILLI